MSTLPLDFLYKVEVMWVDPKDYQEVIWAFGPGYSLAQIKDRVNKDLAEQGYELVRVRQQLDDAVSIEVRSQQLMDQIIRRAARLEDHPLIQLDVLAKPLE